MIQRFEFESESISHPRDCDLFGLLLVEIQVECRDKDGCDATYTIESVTDLDRQREVPYTLLSARDKAKLERLAQAEADKAGPEAYREYARRDIPRKENFP